MPEDQGDLVAVHVRRLRADRELDPVADAAREPGLGLDVRVLDERGLDRDLGGDGGAGKRRLDVAGREAAADEDVAGRRVVQRRRRGIQGVIEAAQRRQRLPGDRQVRVGDRGERPLVATRARIASPRWRTTPSASAGWSLPVG